MNSITGGAAIKLSGNLSNWDTKGRPMQQMANLRFTKKYYACYTL